jgi:hypothetical protein
MANLKIKSTNYALISASLTESILSQLNVNNCTKTGDCNGY